MAPARGARLRRRLCILREDLGQRRAGARRIDPHLQRDVGLERRSEHEVDPLPRQLELSGSLQDADELHLPEGRARRQHRPGGRFGRLWIGEEDLGRRTGGVADDEGPVAFTAAAAELAVVGIFPAFGHEHVVRTQVTPEVQVVVIALFTEGRDGRQQEGQARRGGSRVLHDQQAFVLRVGQVA